MSIRLRLTAAFGLGAALLVGVGAWLFAAALGAGLLGQVDSQLRADLAQAGRLAAAPSGSERTPLSLPGQVVLQVFDASGRLRASTPDAGDARLLSPAQLAEARLGTITTSRTSDEVSTRIMAHPVPDRPGWVAAAAVPLATVQHTMHDVEVALVAAGIAIVLVATGGSYLLARAALSPVERMRREVASLSARADEVSVPVPATHDELAALAETMNDLLGRLHQALSRQRSFVADAAHELRPPFAILQGELELASRPGRSPEEVHRALEHASREASRLTRLANELLLLARGDTDQLALERSVVPIAPLAARAAAGFSTRSGRAGVEIRLRVDEGLAASVDGDRLRQALDNLLDNALRFAPEGSEVALSARDHGGALVLAVSDHGPGFPPEFLPHAFERFTRPDAGRGRAGGGAGLGLAIVQSIAAAHGGRALALNMPGGGAEVRIELPGAVAPRFPAETAAGAGVRPAAPL